MVHLEINAQISPTKQLEFNQSKMSFIQALPKVKGYSGFIEKRGTNFQIKISWLDRASLDNFFKTDYYKFFRGAIITLSSQNETNIIPENLKNEEVK